MSRLTLTAAVLAIAAASASAQTPTAEDIQQDRLVRNTHVVYFGDDEYTDSTAYVRMLNRFYEDQFRHAQDPRAPYFMLLSRSGSIGMGIGGEIQAIADYDWDGSQSGTSFVPYNIPIPVDPTARQTLQMTAERTALYFSVFGNNSVFGDFQVYIHGRFNGPKHAFRLDRAYATVGDWTVGYAKSSYDDPTAQPSTIDTEGPNAEIDDTRLLLRYMHQTSKHFSMAVSVETPSQKVAEADGLYQGIKEYAPDVAAFLQYQLGKQHIRLSGIISPLGYRNLVEGRNHRLLGWGLNLTAKLRPAHDLTLFAAFNTGRGVADMVNDLSYGDNDLLGYADGSGRMYAPWSFGWYGALQYNFSPQVFSTVVVSQQRFLPKANTPGVADMYRYGLYGTANVFWNITTRMQVGAELNIGRRCDMDGTARPGYRASLMGRLSF